MRTPYLFFATTLSLLPASLSATETSSKPVMMDEVVITASRTSEEKKTVSSNITVIDQEEIGRSAADTLADLLAEKGLGHIQKYPGALTAIGIRGFRSDTLGNDLQSHVLILLDGRRAGTGNAAKLFTKNVERIEIIRGPAAVQYGSAGMGGVVNIITKKATRNSAFAETSVGSNALSEGTVGGTVKEGKFDFAGTLTSQTVGDYSTGSGQTFTNSGIDHQSAFSLNSGYSLNANQRLGLVITGSDIEGAGNPGFLKMADQDDTTNTRNYSVDASYSGASTDGTRNWLGRYFFGRDTNTWKFPTLSNPDGYDFGLDSTNTTDQQGAQAQISSAFGQATITAGCDWLHYDVDNSWAPAQTTYSNPAIFLLAKTQLFDPRLTLNAGLRQDWFSVEVTEPAGRDEDQSRLTPQVGLAWQMTNEVKLRTQYAQGFTMPSADQLAADFTLYGLHTIGNAHLDPEKSSTYEAGIDYMKSGLNASFTYFYTDFSDKIVMDYQTDGSQSWKNLGNATISGLEADLSYDIGAPLGLSWEIRPYLNLTLLDTYDDEETGKDLLYVSAVTAAYGISTDNGTGLMLRLNIVSTGSQDVQDYESAVYPNPTVTLGSSTIANISAAWKFWQHERYGALTIRGDILNLTDEEYAYVKGYPMPGRTALVTLRWEY